MGVDVWDGLLFIEFPDGFFRLYIVCCFPTVMCFGETFPTDQVLDLTPPDP